MKFGAGFRPGDRVTVVGISVELSYGAATILAIEHGVIKLRYDHYSYSDGRDGGWGPDNLDFHGWDRPEEMVLVTPTQDEVDAAIASIKTVLERNADG